ncbi:DUF4440 domain-containing protein [Francisella sp. 19X1-34]|uniref:DUF4440 domain-containing protein n=1 Tax=Francisella sp. 19X1-34 TaxID=3087177 RepID=UPI002E36F9A9|nr:DUF4440 domain-containing protein [Francisella sp. 19X1-34]MED7789263.1 hypothetical protein [Francisella sp. 19X1-34]
MNIDQLRKLEESLWLEETRVDKSDMNSILADDFFEYGPSGKIYSRQGIVSQPYQKISAILPLNNFQIRKLANDVYQVTYVS